jgi:hypothetical protein
MSVAKIRTVSGQEWEIEVESEHIFQHEIRRVFDSKGVYQFNSADKVIIVNSTSIESVTFDRAKGNTMFSNLPTTVTKAPTAEEIRKAQLDMQPEALIYEAKERAMKDLAAKENKVKESMVKIYKDKVAPPEPSNV